MTSLATRSRRRRRIAVAAGVAILLTVLAVVSTLWRRSVQETRRAEAQKLLAIAQMQLEDDPSNALAYATSSLELADTKEARVFATRALWAGPPVQVLDLRWFGSAGFMLNRFSPDGRWLVASAPGIENVLVIGDQGGPPLVLGGHTTSPQGPSLCLWSRDGLLVTGHSSEDDRVRVWEMPAVAPIREFQFGGHGGWTVADDRVIVLFISQDEETGHRVGHLSARDLRDGTEVDLGTVDWTALGADATFVDQSGGALVYVRGDEVFARALPIRTGAADRMIARHSSPGIRPWGWGRGTGFFTADGEGEIFLWTGLEGAWGPGSRLARPATASGRLIPDPSGRWAYPIAEDQFLRLWDRQGLEGADPWVLRREGTWMLSFTDFHPGGSWVVAGTQARQELSFWPLSWPHPFTSDGWLDLEFTPDGRHLVSGDFGSSRVSWANKLRLWPLPGVPSTGVVELPLPAAAGQTFSGFAIDPTGTLAVTKAYGEGVFVVPLSGDEPRRFEGFSSNDEVNAVGFSPSGRMVAAASRGTQDPVMLRVWDLVTDEVQIFEQPRDADAAPETYAYDLAFVDEHTLFTAGANGLLRWDLEGGTPEMIRRAPGGGHLGMSAARDGRTALVAEYAGFTNDRRSFAYRVDLGTGDSQSLQIPGRGFLQLSQDGSVWTSAEPDGSIWVGRLDGDQPHLLLGHEGEVRAAVVSPDGRWIASSGVEDRMLRLWPMPDLSKPPLHTLPHDELLAKLRSLTNLRAVRDEESSTGWTIEVGPFPGWATVPEW